MKSIGTLLIMLAAFPCCAQTEDTTLLKVVTVTAKKEVLTQKADRIIYDLRSDPQSTVSSVLDMMRKVPYLSVDANDNILLKGSSSYKVFIDGRPSGLVEGNPKDVLRSIPASTIRSIEVITSPPAKYDAEGLAGIINIITIRQTLNGYRGTANTSARGPAGGPGAGGSFTMKHSGLVASVLAGVNQQKTPEAVNEVTRLAKGRYAAALYQHTTSQSSGNVVYAGIELSYEADSLNLFSAQISYNGSGSAGRSAQSAGEASTDTQYYHLNNNNEKTVKDFDATASYQRKFGRDNKQLLSCSYRYWKDGSAFYDDVVLSDRINCFIPDYRQERSQKLKEHTLQADYEHLINHLTIEAGIKGTFRATTYDFHYDTLDNTIRAYYTDPARSDMLYYDRHILSAYNSYSYEEAGWQLKAGIRAEETIIRLHLMRGDEAFRQQYLNVLPVLVASKKLNNTSSLALSYSRRIQRPRTEELNPFVDRSNPATETSGNPYLQPITSDVYQLSYQRLAKATLNISLSGMFFNHVFSQYPIYNPAANTLLVRYENYGKGRVLKFNFAFNYPVNDKWNFACNADIRHVKTVSGSDHLSADNSGVDIYADASGSYHFGSGWLVTGDITYKKGGILLPLGRTTGFVASSFSLSKNCISSKMTIAASVYNPFTQYRYITETIDTEAFLQTSWTKTYYRQFAVNVNYRFGQLKEDIRKNKKGMDDNEAPR